MSIMPNFIKSFWYIKEDTSDFISIIKESGGVLKIHMLQNSQENTCVGPATLLKKRLWHRCFPVNFEKFLRALFLQKTSGWLLLKNSYISWVIKRSWFKQKSPGLKPDWLQEIKSFLMKNSKNLFKIKCWHNLCNKLCHKLEAETQDSIFLSSL